MPNIARLGRLEHKLEELLPSMEEFKAVLPKLSAMADKILGPE